jgi:hypothetical protein
LIEQKRRQRINEKINELRELLNYPDGSQNKAVVLQAAVENIRYLKLACTKMIHHHRQLQEEHVQLLQENERLRKMLEQQGIKVTPEAQAPQQVDQMSQVPNGEMGNGSPKPSPNMKMGSSNFSQPLDLLRNSAMDLPFALYSDEAHAQTLQMLSPVGIRSLYS